MFKKLLGSFSNDIAIDLGTANTRVFKRDEGIIADEKSAIATGYNRQHQEIVEAVGQGAIDLAREREDIELFRPIQEGLVSNLYAEMLMRYFMELAHDRKGLFAPRVMVSVPYDVTSIQRVALREMLVSAGAREIYLVEKPMATAMGAGLAIKEPKGSLIVDMGAGRTDMAILSLGGIIYGKSISVAGDEMDRSIMRYIEKKFNLIIHKREAERLKIELGTAIELSHELSTKLEYFDQSSSMLRSVNISSKDIQKAIERPLQDIVEALEGLLAYTPIEEEEQKNINRIGAIKQDRRFENKGMDLMRDIARDGLILSGGGALIRGLDRYLSNRLKIPVRLSAEPLLDTVKGLGIILEEIDLFTIAPDREHQPL